MWNRLFWQLKQCRQTHLRKGLAYVQVCQTEGYETVIRKHLTYGEVLQTQKPFKYEKKQTKVAYISRYMIDKQRGSKLWQEQVGNAKTIKRQLQELSYAAISKVDKAPTSRYSFLCILIVLELYQIWVHTMAKK